MARHRANPDVHQLNYFAKSAIFTGCPRGNFLSVVIVCFNLSLRLAHSLIILFFPWLDGVRSGIPGWLYEERKHSHLSNAAEDKLNEEAGLTGGEWVALAAEGIPQDGYSRNRFHPYLVCPHLYLQKWLS